MSLPMVNRKGKDFFQCLVLNQFVLYLFVSANKTEETVNRNLMYNYEKRQV